MKAEIGKQYIHYRNGHTYTVLAVARHTETGEDMVIYQGHYETDDLGKDPIFARPKDMWEEEVEQESQSVPRFAKVA